MADYDRRNHGDFTDGGEGTPRPLKAFRLVDEVPGTEADPADKPTFGAREAVREPSCEDGGGGGYAVLSVTPEGEGDTVAVVLTQPAPEGGKRMRIKLHLLVEQYADLEVKVGAVSSEQADRLTEAGKLCAAVRRGMGLLQYGDQSARRLAYKLTAKGIDRETAAAAAAYLAEKGYIREDDTARLRAEQDVRKGWGLRRICEDLRTQGFSGEVIHDVAEELSEVDFVANCIAVIRKKYGEIPVDRAGRQKLMAAMMRLGYDSDEVREALRSIRREK